MRVSEYFKLNRGQAYLDFVDVKLNTDIAVFVDPSSIKSLNSPWGHECISLLQHFFETVLKHMKNGNDSHARDLLSSLNEKNEFHLGFSKKKSRGHAFGPESAESVWDALAKSEASKSGLLQDLEDTCLMIHGIGRDMVSDAVCNIIRGPLLQYTHEMCDYYGISMEPEIDSGPIWNPTHEQWERKLIPLPITKKYGKLVLVPKIIVRHRLWYRFDEYHRHYLLPVMQKEELDANSALVEVLKDKRKRVTKTSLMEKYGADKLSVVKETLKRPQVLKKYKTEKDSNVPPPLTHKQLAEIEQVESPDWEGLLGKIKKLPTGKDSASEYEDLIEELLTALFYPSLCHPRKQHRIHNGLKRVDITYANEANCGFFSWLGKHKPCLFIFVECKNYRSEIGNPELDQLAGRFSLNRGQVGFLICRKIGDRTTLLQRCKDTAQDNRGYIIPLDDEDLEKIIHEQKKEPGSQAFPMLREIFTSLVT